ncbi:MAG: Slp family lipoprotein [Idiomarina sp.]|nr:Slp family lipoprotein [Idiomarina sp.]
MLVKTGQWLLVIGATVLLSACASRYPEAIRGDGADTVEFREAVQSPELVTGQPARWGGVIAEVTNQENSSVLEIVAFRLRNTGRPFISDDTPGRFRVRVDGFVDPEIYARGRAITTLGTFMGTEEGSIGEYVYHFPLVHAEGVHLWREEEPRARVDVMYYDPHSIWHRHRFYGTGPYRYHPYYFPHGVRGRNVEGAPVIQQSPVQQQRQPPASERRQRQQQQIQ